MSCGGSSGCGGGSSTSVSEPRESTGSRRSNKEGSVRDLLAVDNPNFSVVTKGGCNAKCPFCFSNKAVTPSPTYMKDLTRVVSNMPAEFNRVSVTGGEPTMDPDLPAMLDLLGGRFDKIVLNTNGHKLAELFTKPEIMNINHINISRHGIGKDANDACMQADTIKDDVLETLLEGLSAKGIDATLTCVIDDSMAPAFIREYIAYAKMLGAPSVCFRKKVEKGSTLEPSKLEQHYLNYKIIEHDACPVCRTDVRLIQGMRTLWKAGCVEPSDVLELVYELVFQQDGRLTGDWAGKHEMKVVKGILITPTLLEMCAVRQEMEQLNSRMKALDQKQRRIMQKAREVKDLDGVVEKI
jgi:MoaA/NifB/PqqE/SkfB family radical SAM enzyme